MLSTWPVYSIVVWHWIEAFGLEGVTDFLLTENGPGRAEKCPRAERGTGPGRQQGEVSCAASHPWEQCMGLVDDAARQHRVTAHQ